MPRPLPDRLPDGLRPWRAGDAPALVRAWHDPDIVAWNAVPAERGLPAARDWIAGWSDRWRRELSFDLVIAPDAALAGEIGLRNLTREPIRAELGIWIAAGHRGRGLAGAALERFVPWALAPEGLGLDQIWARTAPGNEAAGALFAAADWAEVGEAGGARIWSIGSGRRSHRC